MKITFCEVQRNGSSDHQHLTGFVQGGFETGCRWALSPLSLFVHPSGTEK